MEGVDEKVGDEEQDVGAAEAGQQVVEDVPHRPEQVFQKLLKARKQIFWVKKKGFGRSTEKINTGDRKYGGRVATFLPADGSQSPTVLFIFCRCLPVLTKAYWTRLKICGIVSPKYKHVYKRL